MEPSDTLDGCRRSILTIRKQLAAARTAADHAKVQELAARLVSQLRRFVVQEPLDTHDAVVNLLGVVATCDVDWAAAPAGAAADLAAVLEHALRILDRIYHRDARSQRHHFDRGGGLVRLFSVWQDDGGRVLGRLGDRLLRLAEQPADRRELLQLTADALADLPVPFPGTSLESLDPRRLDLAARRWALDRLAGEILAGSGGHEYGIAAARQRARMTGDAREMIAALVRAGRSSEAMELSRRLSAAPSAEPVRAAAGGLQEPRAEAPARRIRVACEARFLAEPDSPRFEELRRATTAEHWPRVRGRVLGHLQKHQRCPELVFRLYVDEGMFTDADGLVVTQPIDAAVLMEAARSIEGTRAELAAGWMIVAAHRVADAPGGPRAEEVAQILAHAGRLAAAIGADEGFSRMLARFRSRHADSEELLRSLVRAGL